MQAISGVIYHSISGFAAGSFYMPYNKVRGWAWESYWIVGGLFSWIIVPPLAAWLTVPGFAEIISISSMRIIYITYLMGILWGGFTTNFIWTTFLNLKNRTHRDFFDKTKPLFNNYIFAALAGTIWFLQFFFYGMGESNLGNSASSWILHIPFVYNLGFLYMIIICSSKE